MVSRLYTERERRTHSCLKGSPPGFVSCDQGQCVSHRYERFRRDERGLCYVLRSTLSSAYDHCGQGPSAWCSCGNGVYCDSITRQFVLPMIARSLFTRILGEISPTQFQIDRQA